MNQKNKKIIISAAAVALVCALAAGIWIAVGKNATPDTRQQTTSLNDPTLENETVESADDGKSAYELAASYGFEGSEEQWLASVQEKTGNRSANVSGAFVNENNHLVVSFDDGTKSDLGYVSPKNSSENAFTVLFKDFDGAVLKRQTVNKGENAIAPENPTRDGYIFTGWDNSFTNVQSSIVVTAQYAEDSNLPAIIVENITASAGDTVTVNAVIKNNPGILGASMVVNYDSDSLTLIKAETGDAFSALNVTKPAKFKDGCIFPAYAERLDEGDIKDGTVLTLTFKVSKSASAGSYFVSVSCPEGDAFDKDNNVINVIASPGSITII